MLTTLPKMTFAVLALTPLNTAYAQVQMSQVVKLGDQARLTSDDAFRKYITRDSFCTLVLENLIFSESAGGKFMLDLAVKFNPESPLTPPLRVLFSDLIELKKPGEPIKLNLPDSVVARQITLSSTTDIDITLRVIPVVDGRYDEMYSTLMPLLSAPSYVPAVGTVLNKFIDFSTKDDKRPSLVFQANIPVAQNIIEAQRTDTNALGGRSPLLNGYRYAIAIEGSKQITDQSIVGKAKDILNGVTNVIAGKSVVERPESIFKGLAVLRFHKDNNIVLPEPMKRQLIQLNDLAEEATTEDAVSQLQAKAREAIAAVEALATAQRIDTRTEFHLKGQVNLARAWGLYTFASQGGERLLRDNDLWRVQFSKWFNLFNYDGQSQDIQAYGLSGIYAGNKLAKIFVPYALTDRMTLQSIRWQVVANQTLERLANRELAQDPPK
jgi:hypothetical protein